MKRKLHSFLTNFLFIFLSIIFCFSFYKVITTVMTARQEQEVFTKLASLVSQNTKPLIPGNNNSGDASSDSSHENSPTKAGDDSSSVLTQYEPLYEQNGDFYGWLCIEGTPINYPVMYTPQDSEYYLRRDFYGKNSQSGTPFVDGECLSEGSYLLIYGHNMKNKSMFGSLPDYAEFSYYKEHPDIYFDTRFEHREYQVVATFYSRLYKENERNVFRYYTYKDLPSPQIFDNYMVQVKNAALYDTGIDAAYGDQILVLSTCDYHTSEGRFVVVAKRIR